MRRSSLNWRQPKRRFLTRHGQAVVRLVPVKPARDVKTRRGVLQTIREAASAKVCPGPDAARSQDFLYNESGLPE
jgi:antitoxin (DNA-binding transcriptional repressor) of toxin-antitoxin stability system